MKNQRQSLEDAVRKAKREKDGLKIPQVWYTLMFVIESVGLKQKNKCIAYCLGWKNGTFKVIFF